MKRNIKDIFLILGMLLIAFYIQIPQNSENMLKYAISNIAILVVYVCIVCAWRASIHRRVIHKMMKAHADGIVFFMIMWIISRTLRYTVFFNIEPWERICWYSYYIPMIFIPAFCFMSARCMGQPEDWKPEKEFYYAYIIAFAMVFGVMTNDIHQLAFKLRVGANGMIEVYDRGPVYYCIILWAVILSIAMMLVLLRKFRVPGTRKIMWLPIVATIIGGIGSLVYVANEVSGFVEFSIVSCCVIIGAWESCIWTGLMPSNTHYEEVLRASSISAQIIDQDNNVCYKSDRSMIFDNEIIEKVKKESVMLDENTRLRSTPITGGHALWTEDISLVNSMLAELEEIGQNLMESNDLLSKEIALKQRKGKIDEKNRLYDRIAQSIERQLTYIRNMLKDINPDDEYLDTKFSVICILGAYIKRRTNLELLRENADKLSAEELNYSIRESVECMKACNISCSFRSDMRGEIDADIMILIYNVFERAVERALNDLYSVLVNLEETSKHFYLKMVLEDYRALLPEDFCKEEIAMHGGSLHIEEIDGAEYVTLCLPKGGEEQV